MPPAPDHRNFDKIKADINQNGTYLTKKGLETAEGIWYGHPSPFEGLRMMGRFSEGLLHKGFRIRIPDISEELRRKLSRYVHQIHMKPIGSETLLTVVVEPFAFLKEPLG